MWSAPPGSWYAGRLPRSGRRGKLFKAVYRRALKEGLITTRSEQDVLIAVAHRGQIYSDAFGLGLTD